MSVKKKKLSPFMRRKAAAAEKAAAEKARQIAERDRRIFGKNSDQWEP